MFKNCFLIINTVLSLAVNFEIYDSKFKLIAAVDDETLIPQLNFGLLINWVIAKSAWLTNPHVLQGKKN